MIEKVLLPRSQWKTLQLSLFITLLMVLGGCFEERPVRYSKVGSPHGRYTVVKQYSGDRDVSLSIVLLINNDLGSRESFILKDVPLEGVWGSDGILFSWDDDSHLTLGWPAGGNVKAGPAKIDGVTLTYKNYPIEPYEQTQSENPPTPLTDIEIEFLPDLLKSDTNPGVESGGGSRCFLSLRGNNPENSEKLIIQLSGNTTGLLGDGTLSIGMADLMFAIEEGNSNLRPGITHGGINSLFLSAPRQVGKTLVYSHLQKNVALKILQQLRSRHITIDLSTDLGTTIKTYVMEQANDAIVGAVFNEFYKCAAGTRLYGNDLEIMNK